MTHFPPFFPPRLQLRAAPLWAALVGAILAGPLVAQDAPKVTIAAAFSAEVTQEVTFIGRGEAIDKVDIVARVSGYLQERAVDDGASIEEGQLLFRIEPDLYEATLQARKADLDRAEANLELARVELARKEELLKRDAVPVSERDIARANELVAEAEVKSAEAAIRQAELDLSYTEITAPFAGRIGQISTSIGDVVGPNTAPLVTLVRDAPIEVAFAVNERQLTNTMEELDETPATLLTSDNSPEVHVRLPNGTPLGETGKLVFIDNRVDPDTGAISIRAKFDNEHRLIADGSFVQVQIQAPQPVEQVLAPQAALQRDQRGEFVLVVTDQQMVEQRYVQTGQLVDRGIVILDGLRAGESVIVEGLQRVRPGVAVDAVLASDAAGN
ncbi:membrane fusion protein, multidrug efflux system [Cribrihabitans marinus]|uniref:Membrane fusion protein, multidrug efflux system n=1 Tax=Cribrihabitans marinus TaxID=1227549 RepID=A0A1H6ZUF7_9RHOB|nr:efflux RND transporter periplasmic adaptor subunit [Cribrihabitans marinus]GGH30700.1 MexE family multidrug efflux RND transporter periplasmic adaptor subunit [Cribrihabitans marinus]SEJ52455.1 membrane fusion protein, multidrug efflux system [Cribrihabitans marinus]